MIAHIGIAVHNLEKSIALYERILGLKVGPITLVPDQKVRVAMFCGEQGGEGDIELIEATSDDSPIAIFLSKRGEGMHHICVYVDDIESRLSELEKSGAKLIDKTPRIGASGNKIAFISPSSTGGVLLELEEKRK